MKSRANVCLAAAVVMMALLTCLHAGVTTPAAASTAAALLSQAESVKVSDPARLNILLAQLRQHEEQLTVEQRWELRLLDAWRHSFDGDYAKADPLLQNIIDHSGSKSLAIRAMSLLTHERFVSRQYVSGYTLVNSMMAALPGVTDTKARIAGMSQAIKALNQSAVGEYDLALQYALQMKTQFPAGVGRCYADTFEIKSLMYGGKLSSGDARFQQAIAMCLAAGVPLNADSLRLDLASKMTDEGHAAQAIAFLNRMAPEIRKNGYPPFLASLPVTLAQAYLGLGDTVNARKFALDSIAITGANTTMWTLQAAYEVLYKAEKANGHAVAALDYYEKYVALENAAMDDAKARALAYQMVRQQVQAKKMKLDALSKQNSILQLRQALASQGQRTGRLYIALLLVVLAFITLAMFWLRRSQLRFRRMARHDGLTGAFNREHFFEEAGATLRRLHKTRASACLVLLDLDNFKQVNDTHGHAAGDEVLRHAVAACQGELRGSDVFGRLGGEEFGILMPACSREQGIEIATRIRCALAVTPTVLDSQTTIYVSGSLGVACRPHSDLTLHQMLREADLALYRAKAAGRDCVDAGEDLAAMQDLAAEGVATPA